MDDAEVPREAATKGRALLRDDRTLVDGVALLLRARASEEAPKVRVGAELGAAMERLGLEHYLALGVHPRATPAEITKSYRKLCLQFHPDKSAGTTELFQLVSHANEVLSDEAQRAKYDRARPGAAGRPRGPTAAPPPPPNAAAPPPPPQPPQPPAQPRASGKENAAYQRGAHSSARGENEQDHHATL